MSLGKPVQPTASELKELQAALNAAEARYASLLERTGYGVYRSSPDGRFLEVNHTLAEMLGFDSPEALMTVDLARDIYLDPHERDRLRGEHTDERFPEWVETQWKRHDGTPVRVRLSVRRRLDANGDLDAYDGIVEDVSERMRRDELLRRSERMASLGSTLAGVAHELNNPLAAIMGFAQLLLKKPWPDEDRAALETINHEAIRSAAIVRDLLAMTRRRSIEPKVRVDVNDVVGYVVRTRRYTLETAGIRCELQLEPSLPAVDADRAQLEQVVLNLLNNAEQALASRDEHGQIRIRTRRDAGDVIVEVEDNGPGVTEADRTRIWDPFWTTKEEGTGLGLTVVHGIVADHSGTISVESAARGGARFIIRLPASSRTMQTPATGRAARPLDVLVVDPGATDLMFVERFFTSRGHAVVNAGSGELALRLAEQTSFDAVVCDASLVSRNGTPVAQSLRAARGCANARFVLAMSPGQPPPQPSIDGAALVARPYDVEELRRVIEGD
jgi:PAS domain S-box-containing protein